MRVSNTYRFAAGISTLLASLIGGPRPARAHGEPASVLGGVQPGVDGRPEVLRLSEGLALRGANGARYLCPALFDSDETPRVAALHEGPTLVATRSELFLLTADGAVEPYPDVRASGAAISGLDADDSDAFLLRATDGGAELVRLDGEHADPVAELPPEYGSLAVEQGRVLVAGVGAGGRVLQRGFDGRGNALPAWSAEASGPLDSVAAFARIARGEPFVVVVAGGELGSELARIDAAGRYHALQRAGSVISGPIAAGEHTLFAFDGRLAELAGEAVTPSAEQRVITCVVRAGSRAYACASSDLLALQDGAIGDRVFALDEVAPPELDALERERAERCLLQWLRFRADLARAGITPRDEPVARDAGANDEAAKPPAGDASAARVDAGAGKREADAGDCSAAGPVHPTERRRSAFLQVGTAVGVVLAARLLRRAGRRERACMRSR